MNPELSPKLVEMIESVCAQGCSQVNEILECARNGESVSALKGLSSDEIALVLEELDQIMSVYTGDD